MSLRIKEHHSIFVPVPEGLFVARCIALIDLGKQYSHFYGNALPKILIGWELTDALAPNGQPWIHWQRYTASLNPKSSLRALLEAWRGRAFTPEELNGFALKPCLGSPCYLTIKHVLNPQMTQRWSKVDTICPLPKVIPCPPPTQTLIYFDGDEYSESDYLAVPETIRRYINVPPPRVSYEPCSSRVNPGCPDHPRNATQPQKTDETPCCPV